MNTLLVAREQLIVLRKTLGPGGPSALDRAAKERIEKACSVVIVAFHEIHGHAQKADEGE